MSHAVRGLVEGSEGLTRARTKFLTGLGDAVNLSRKLWGEEEGDNIIAQAIPVEGQGKHNVLQSAAVMAYIDNLYPDMKDRPISLSFTHLQEAKNYGRNKDGSNAIPPAKVRSILSKAVDDGLSCADMRELLKAARPKVEPVEGEETESEGGEDEGGDTAAEVASLYGFTYALFSDTSQVLFTEELDRDLLKAKDDDGTQKYLVFDLAAKAVLNEKGKIVANFTEPEGEVEEGSDLPE
jgi:hypothetical protein